ncbi:hypothetical protein NKH77_48400 [Streptomyces sp. M19]
MSHAQQTAAADRERLLDRIWSTEPFARAAARTEHLCGCCRCWRCSTRTRSASWRTCATASARPRSGCSPQRAVLLPASALSGIRDGERVLLDGGSGTPSGTPRWCWSPYGSTGNGGSPAAAHRRRRTGHGPGWARRAPPGCRCGRCPGRSAGAGRDADRRTRRLRLGVLRRALAVAARHVADLRRALAATGAGTDALSTSQYLAHEISKVEIELSLAAAAAALGPDLKGEGPGGQSAAAVLLSCADLLPRVGRLVADMAGELGLSPAPGAADGWADAVPAHLGGPRLAGGELARRMGLLAGTAGA